MRLHAGSPEAIRSLGVSISANPWASSATYMPSTAPAPSRSLGGSWRARRAADKCEGYLLALGLVLWYGRGFGLLPPVSSPSDGSSEFNAPAPVGPARPPAQGARRLSWEPAGGPRRKECTRKAIPPEAPRKEGGQGPGNPPEAREKKPAPPKRKKHFD